MNKFPL